jgi:hypothetical protein
LEAKTLIDEYSVKREGEPVVMYIPGKALDFVMDDCVHRLKQCIELTGNYVS